MLLDDRGHDPTRPDAVAAAEQRLLLTVLVEERRAERRGVEAAEIEDVTDLDRGLEDERAPAQPAAVAFARLAQIGESRLVVAARLDAAQVPPVVVCAGDELPFAERLVGDHLAREADGAERAAARAERRSDLVVRRRTRCAGQRVVELRLAEPVVAADEREHEGAVRLDDRHRLRGRRRVDPEELGQPLDRRHSGRLDLLWRAERIGQDGGARNRLRHLEVARVVAVLAPDERVLARAGRRQEVDAELAAHDPALRLDVVRLQRAAGEDLLVRVAVRLEARAHALLVTVERVGVLHDELADPQESAARTRLVAILRLEVVPELRQIAVALELARVERDRLFVGQRQDEVSTGPILHTEDLRNRQAARCLPELGGSEDGHQHLLAADRVHLLADDLLDLPVDAPAERRERPEARRDLADEASADEQLVAHRFGIARILPEGRDEELGGSLSRLCYWTGAGPLRP